MKTQLPATPKRRWIQFSLRTMLVVMLLAAAYLGGRMPVLRELQATRQRMAAIENQAAAAMMEARRAQEVAELQRLRAEEQRALAEHQMQALKNVSGPQDHRPAKEPEAESNNAGSPSKEPTNNSD